MPSFNYHCKSCDTTIEDFRNFKDREKSQDCKCGAKAAKTFSTPSLLFDGSDPDRISAHSRWVKEHEVSGNGIRT